MASFNYPFHVTKDTPAVATEVQSNFDALLAWVMDNVMQKDGTNGATGPIVLPPGPPTSPDQAANKAYVDAMIPVGAMYPYGGTVLPAKWLWCNGVTYTNTSQPLLAAAIARAFTDAAVPAGSFSVPDLRKRLPAGADAGEAAVFGLGVKGGQRNSELQTHQHNVSAYGHTASGGTNGGGGVDHLHQVGSLGTTTTGQHGHNLGHGSQITYVEPNQNEGVPGPGSAGRATWLHDGNHAHGITGQTGASDRSLDHNHPVFVSVNNHDAKLTDPSGAGTTLIDKNLPPYVAVNYIIYAGA